MTAPKRDKPPPSDKPWNCIVLAVDPGTRSGWSAFAGGEYVNSGECPLKLSSITLVVQAAMSIATFADLPCVLVMERPFGQRPGRMFGGSGKGRELWRAVWEECGGVKSRVVSVYPSTWRARVLGRGMGNAKRDIARENEQLQARQVLGKFRVGADEAPAVCIGVWASRAGEVGKVLPKRHRETVP